MYPNPLDPQWVCEYIPELKKLEELKVGIFIMGKDYELDEWEKLAKEYSLDDELPSYKVYSDNFFISKYPVARADFRRFVEVTGYQIEAEKENWASLFKGNEVFKEVGLNWRCDVNGNFLSEWNSEREKHPVVFISWNDTNAYCQWMSEISGLSFSLPTEAE